MRTGAQYLKSLSDGRAVFLDGAKVEDVPSHEAFHGIARSVAKLYDVAADPANGMIYKSPETGGDANKVFMIPRSPAELAERHRALASWADVSKGWVGRSPDHVGGFLAGFASSPATFDKGDRQFGKNVTRWYRKVVEESAFVSYVIIPPQIDRSTTAHGWSEELLQVGVLKEQDGGMVVRGSQMLGTATAVSDYLFVSCIKPMAPQDERYAISFIIPVNTPGLKVYCRRPYAVAQPSSYDYPLSTRFDETDALIVFDDVSVPWENVFVYRDVDQLKRQFFETAAHVLGNNQAQIRLVAKMKFILGVARKITQVNGVEGIPSVQEKLGELASLASYVEGLVIASEATCTMDRNGVARPNPRFVYGAMGLQAEIYPRAILILRELAGGGVIQLPSSHLDMTSEATKADMERFMRSPNASPEERVKLFKLAWDIVGSEFGGRHQQYEMFYAGAPFVAKGYAFRNYGYDEALQSVDSFLKSYELPRAPGWDEHRLIFRRLSVSKPEFEFFPATDVGWTPVPGKASGLKERILSHDKEAGVATRILHFSPGADTSPNGTQTHDFWEEVYILEGAIYDIPLGKNFTAGMYACRPPGMKHGPWSSKDGCTTFEVRYYKK